MADELTGAVDPSNRETAAPLGPSSAPAPAPSRRVLRRRRSLRVRRLLAGAVVAGLLVLGFVAWLAVEAYPLGGPGRPVVIEVTDGEALGQIVSALEGKGVIGSSLAFRLDLAVAGTPTVRPGWYELRQRSSFGTVRGVLASGPNARVLAVTVGQTTHTIATHLASVAGPSFASRFLMLARHPAGVVRSPFQPSATSSLEGLLAPGTYVLPTGATPSSLLGEMAAAFVPRAAGQGLLPSTRAHGLDAYQLVIVASIIEKEGYLPRNMARVSRVIYNRLARGALLQMDATVMYAINQDGGPVTHATEAIRSPYNTYLNTGLTPTPICIPSTEAIDAAMHPATGPWLYFTLVDRGGTLAFSTTFAEQLANEHLAHERGL